jgi:hypothetical protein
MPVVARQDRTQERRHVLTLLLGRDQAPVDAGDWLALETGRRWRMAGAGGKGRLPILTKC